MTQLLFKSFFIYLPSTAQKRISSGLSEQQTTKPPPSTILKATQRVRTPKQPPNDQKNTHDHTGNLQTLAPTSVPDDHWMHYGLPVKSLSDKKARSNQKLYMDKATQGGIYFAHPITIDNQYWGGRPPYSERTIPQSQPPRQYVSL